MATTGQFYPKPYRMMTISLRSVGYEECYPYHSWSGERDHYLIHYIYSGKGNYTVNGKTYSLGAGDTFIVYPWTEVLYRADGDDPWEYCWVAFTDGESEYLVDKTDFTRENPIIRNAFGNELKNAIMKVYAAQGAEVSDIVRMIGALYQMLALMIEKSSVREKKTDIYDDYVHMAKEFISVNFMFSIGIEDISESLGISRTSLYRAFGEICKTSPLRYLTNYRIDLACAMLSETERSVSAVSKAVGYDDPRYFSRVFRKITGKTPSEYRWEKS